MPLACGGAAGVPKPGAPRFIAVTSAAIDGFISAIVGAATNPYAGAALNGVLAGKTYDANTICASPDPGDPTLSVTDLINAAQAGGSPVIDTAIAKVEQWFLHMIWPNLCDCTDGSAPPASTTAPIPVVGTNPGMPAGASRSNCWDANTTRIQESAGQFFFQELTPPGGTVLSPWPGANGPAPIALPTPRPTSYRFDGVMHGNPATDGYTAQFNPMDSTGTIIPAEQQNQGTTAAETPFAFQGTLTAATTYLYIFLAHTTGTTAGLTASGRLQLFCGTNDSTTVLTPCCPPDLSLDLRLRRIEDLEHTIISLLGKSAGFTAYAESTVHSGLTGAGTVTLGVATVAVKVTITADTSGAGSSPGNPSYLFDRGFIVPITAEAPVRAPARLVYSPQQYNLPLLTEQVGYTLKPGVTVSITELIPGAA